MSKACECGCGQEVDLAPYSTVRLGWLKGQPKRFINGHNKREQRDSLSLQLKILERSHVDGECWVWSGAVASSGYGRIGWTTEQNERRTFQVHRVSYEAFIGEIPPGLHIDHLCSNKLCVNPDHLEPVTQTENNRRSRQRRKMAHA